MDDNFCHKPFRGLDPRSYPYAKKRVIQGAEAIVAEGLQVFEARMLRTVCQTAEKYGYVNSEEEERDRELFLQAVQRLPENAFTDGLRKPFLSLSEQCPMLKKKKRQAKGEGSGRHSEESLLSASKGAGKAPQDSFADEQKTAVKEEGMAESMSEALEGAVSEKELHAFFKAVDGAEPIKKKGRVIVPEKRTIVADSVSDDLAALMSGKLEFQLLCRDEYFEGHIAGLDQMTVDKLASGGLSPEAHLDLHGCTTVQAFEALRSFVKSSWYKGLRTLLVIPGRGRNSLDRFGVLRSKLQSWLTQEPLKRVVLAFCTAQPHDGGPGSVYVLLRKYRKKGRVFWERLPLDEDLY